jgi:hypothetical protein
MFNNLFSENRAVYEIIWKNMVQLDRPQMNNIIRRMRVACWKTKAEDTHLEYVILIAFPRQQRLHERVSMLRYTYIASLAYSANLTRQFRNCRSELLTSLRCPYIEFLPS